MSNLYKYSIEKESISQRRESSVIRELFAPANSGHSPDEFTRLERLQKLRDVITKATNGVEDGALIAHGKELLTYFGSKGRVNPLISLVELDKRCMSFLDEYRLKYHLVFQQAQKGYLLSRKF